MIARVPRQAVLILLLRHGSPLVPTDRGATQEELTMKIPTLTLSAAIATALLAGPAIAAEDQTVRSVEVRYADLDLTSAEGVQAFDRRLERAARSVCRADEFRIGTTVVAREARACYKQTRKQMDNRLAAIVDEKTRG